MVARTPEAMPIAVASGQELAPLVSAADVLVVGPGLGQSPWSEQLLQVAAASNKPMVLDADGLNLLAQGRVVDQVRRDNWVLTPHPGEAARLLQCANAEVQADRFAAVRALQQRYGGVVLLKGSGSLIAGADRVLLSDYGNPGMASGGMGDVLSGVIGSLLAQHLDALSADRHCGLPAWGGRRHRCLGRGAARSVGHGPDRSHARAARLMTGSGGSAGRASSSGMRERDCAAQLALVATDEAAMIGLGAALAEAADQGLVVFLEGDLGMGKTTLTRGFIQSRGHSGAVKSPTYTLVEPYALASGTVYHFDLYRLGDPEELEFMGILDYFGEDAICIVEWPGRGAGVLPPADLVINLERDGKGRRLQLCASSAKGKSVLAHLATDERLQQ